MWAIWKRRVLYSRVNDTLPASNRFAVLNTLYSAFKQSPFIVQMLTIRIAASNKDIYVKIIMILHLHFLILTEAANVVA